MLTWLAGNFPGYVYKPFGERHLRLWDWIEALEPGTRPAPRVEVWPRGGAKSTTGELGIARIGFKLARKYVLYVSETQDQADKHVAAVANLFERLGMDRALNKYGSSKGWRRNQLRVSNGFSVEGIGLDTASRGAKIDEDRPGLIIFDDIDNQNDSPRTVERKQETVKSAIIPAGSPDVALLFLQNLIHDEGIVARLQDDRADFLLDRVVPPISVAIEGLEVETVDRGDGRKIYKIVGGTPTWDGQDIAICEAQINAWGYRTFLREAQHEVSQADGYFFDHTKIEIVDELPDDIELRFALAFDLAATEGGGDYTVWVLMAIGKNGVVYVLDVFRRQISSDKVRAEIRSKVEWFQRYRGGIVHLPQDPGQAGKDQAMQFRQMLEPVSKGLSVRIEPVTGKKAVRARGIADKVNGGNVKFLRGEWNHFALNELRKFTEDETHEHDDFADAFSDGYNELSPPTLTWSAY